jgi:hypothetical protein
LPNFSSRKPNYINTPIKKMGLCNSKSNTLSHLDDSVKVMVRHDAKMLAKKGEKPGGYVPRAPHPMLDQQEKEKEQKKAVAVEAEETDL